MKLIKPLFSFICMLNIAFASGISGGGVLPPEVARMMLMSSDRADISTLRSLQVGDSMFGNVSLRMNELSTDFEIQISDDQNNQMDYEEMKLLLDVNSIEEVRLRDGRKVRVVIKERSEPTVNQNLNTIDW